MLTILPDEPLVEAEQHPLLAKWEKLRQKRLGSVRRPPRQPDFSKPKGTCRWCFEPVLEEDGSVSKRRAWHRSCIGIWNVATSQSAARDAVYRRDKGVCAGCGWSAAENSMPEFWYSAKLHPQHAWDLFRSDPVPPDTTWQGDVSILRWVEAPWFADHITPLWSVDRIDPTSFFYWTLGNLQTLCGPCHLAKSAKEAAFRASLRRGSGFTGASSVTAR
jgi:hypothetical protein